MYTVRDIMQKSKRFVDWLDKIPSVPAAAGAFLLGLVLSVKFVIIVVLIVAAYVAILYYNK